MKPFDINKIGKLTKLQILDILNETQSELEITKNLFESSIKVLDAYKVRKNKLKLEIDTHYYQNRYMKQEKLRIILEEYLGKKFKFDEDLVND